MDRLKIGGRGSLGRAARACFSIIYINTDLLLELTGVRWKLVPGWASNSASLFEKQTHQRSRNKWQEPPIYVNFTTAFRGAAGQAVQRGGG